MKLDLTSFRNALDRLDEALGLCDSAAAKGASHLAQVLRCGTIQAFGCSYELCIKTLKYGLIEYEISPDDIDDMSFNALIRRGYEAGLLKVELSVWKQFRHYRTISGHAYDELKAAEIYKGIPAFRAEARFLLAELERRQDD